ncbi:hypothetical protein AAG906_041076 [Vitis piasezkii]
MVGWKTGAEVMQLSGILLQIKVGYLFGVFGTCDSGTLHEYSSLENDVYHARWKIREKEKGKRGDFIGILFTEASPLTSSSSVAMASHRCRPFQRPPLSLRPPSSAENLPFSGTQVPMDELRSSNQVPMDEMNSSNPVNVFGSMSSDQV